MEDKEEQIRQIKGEEEINEDSLFLGVLERALNDFATVNENESERSYQWWTNARDWLFGESKELSQNDNRGYNLTLEEVCSHFGGSIESVRNTALFMRRFGLNSAQLRKVFFDDEDQD